jgi:hypothetical protein
LFACRVAKTAAWCAPAVCAPRRGLLGCRFLFACLPACLIDCMCPSQRASCVLLAWWRAGRRSSNGREQQHVAPAKMRLRRSLALQEVL